MDRNHSGESNSPFQAVVARDGSGDYRTVQEAVNAAPENSKTPWCIFVKNGSYREYLFIPKTKTFIHLIGQDKDKTIIHHSLNVGGKPERLISIRKTSLMLTTGEWIARKGRKLWQ